MLDLENLKEWFLASKRDFPWRKALGPYAVWVSEVMLQQTQASVVIPYFEKWMAQFPTIQALAEAPLEVVIKAWEGLGYYSRARNLHEGAKTIVANFNGQLPETEADLAKIKGLGPYTIGAILSFAFHKKKAAVDGNVLRVLTRYYHLEEDISKASTQKKVRQLADELLPEEEPWVIAEALIELGATICQKKARCTACPLQPSCQSFRHQAMDFLPVNSKKIQIERLYRAVAILQFENCYLVRKGQKGEIMSDLTEFPYFDVAKEGISSAHFEQILKANFGLSVRLQESLPSFSHGFTRFQARLDPFRYICDRRNEVLGYEWVNEEDLKLRTFSSGHRRILNFLLC